MIENKEGRFLNELICIAIPINLIFFIAFFYFNLFSVLNYHAILIFGDPLGFFIILYIFF